jgi:nucleotide-binding universal stress UspA family protein
VPRDLIAPIVSVRTTATYISDPFDLEAAREHDADLVVVPMRARAHELGHVLHDHADRYVLHHCDVPVLVVPTTS